MSLADYADSNDGRGIIYALESVAEQLRIANLIALTRDLDIHPLRLAAASALVSSDVRVVVRDNIRAGDVRAEVAEALGLATGVTS